MSSRAEYVGCTQEIFGKYFLPMPYSFFFLSLSLFCCWLFFGVVWWTGWLKSDQMRHIYSLTIQIYSSGTSVACGRTILVTSLVTHCYGMTSFSSTSICVVVLVTLARMAHPSWSHNCSLGLRWGLLAGHSLLSTPKFWRWSLMNPALWGVILGDRV